MMNNDKFNIPVVLIFFNRPHYFQKIVEIIKELKPTKLYLISDGARENRNGEEELVLKCRKMIDDGITWDCDVKRNYAFENKGCYDRIANGASWVFSQEEKAIFLEDDNIPQLSFFDFCASMLERYESNEKIFWICGGNYLVDYQNGDGSSYLYSKQMFPCGWASWSRAWRFYDGEMNNYTEENKKKALSKIQNKNIRYYKRFVWDKLKKQQENGKRLYTWDHQWNFTMLLNDGYGIVPKLNQINNIGIGEDSTHGGVELTTQLSQIVMLKSIPIERPYIAPKEIKVDCDFEEGIEKRIRGITPIRYYLSRFKRRILRSND